MNYFTQIFQKYHQNVKQFGSRSGPIWVQTVCKDYQQMTRAGKEVSSTWLEIGKTGFPVKSLCTKSISNFMSHVHHDSLYMSLVVRKPFFGVSDQVQHKPGCTATEDGLRLEISEFRKKRDWTICVAKTKVLISCAITAQLICAFVFAYAKIRFSHDAAHIRSFVVH